MKIALGSDHKGYRIKETIKKYLNKYKVEYTDFGTFKIDECDYPEFGYKVSQAVSSGECDLGILVGETGMGMCIIANKAKDVRAVVADNDEEAKK
ncbi:MAG TPA: RpiB/LacA/LacB family sugar-phosphate isomerase, partial [Calditrichaeota bacterium]|nr:RpiB/LacA/LacB family sugar-phosphate isomerase [Calditrichota bacterium]